MPCSPFEVNRRFGEYVPLNCRLALKRLHGVLYRVILKDVLTFNGLNSVISKKTGPFFYHNENDYYHGFVILQILNFLLHMRGFISSPP
jgi:hypothetical protein